jgi:hypothetical protein
MRPGAIALLALILGAGPAFAQDTPAAGKLNSLEELRRHFSNCYQPGTVSEGKEVTVRFALRRDGSLLGKPRVTYVKGAENATIRKVLSDAAVNAIATCVPAPLTEAFGRALAGRVYSIRFSGRRALPLS